MSDFNDLEIAFSILLDNVIYLVEDDSFCSQKKRKKSFKATSNIQPTLIILKVNLVVVRRAFINSF